MVDRGRQAAGGGAPASACPAAATGGADLVILDDAATPGAGAPGRAARAAAQARRSRSSATTPWPWTRYVTDADANLYNLYVVDPSENQILRYAAGAGRQRLLDAVRLPATDNENVRRIPGPVRGPEPVHAQLRQAWHAPLRRPRPGLQLATPPDDDDMRPGHDYRFVAEYNDRFYVYDAKWSRVRRLRHVPPATTSSSGRPWAACRPWRTCGHVPDRPRTARTTRPRWSGCRRTACTRARSWTTRTAVVLTHSPRRPRTRSRPGDPRQTQGPQEDQGPGEPAPRRG